MGMVIDLRAWLRAQGFGPPHRPTRELSRSCDDDDDDDDDDEKARHHDPARDDGSIGSANLATEILQMLGIKQSLIEEVFAYLDKTDEGGLTCGPNPPLRYAVWWVRKVLAVYDVLERQG